MRTRLLALFAVLAAALVPAGANAATISVSSAPFASTVGLSWDVTAGGSETVFRAQAPCVGAPMGGAVPVNTFVGSPPVATSTTDAPGDGAFCYYVQDDGSAFGYGNTVQALVDTTSPNGTLNSPGGVLAGTIPLTATASDAVAGVDKVEFQSSPAGANTWSTFDTDTTDNAVTYHGSLNTNTLVGGDGFYDLRVKVTDLAGNLPGFSPAVAGVRVDNTAPGGTLTSPGAVVTGTLGVTATASDAGAGVDKVEFQSSPAGANTWSTYDTDTTDNAVTYHGALNTTTLAGDGLYDLRVKVTDLAGNPGFSSTLAGVRVDNTAPTVSVTAPAASSNIHGTSVAVSANALDTGGSGVTSVDFFAQGSGGPISLGSDGGSPFSVTWNTTGAPDGLYTVWAVATDGATLQTISGVIANVRVDNTVPAGAVAAPLAAANLGGTVNLSATATDTGGSGVASVRFEAATTGGFSTIATSADSSSPYSATWNTAGLNATYHVRAVITDAAGNPFTTTPAVDVTVDNHVPNAPAVPTGLTTVSSSPTITFGGSSDPLFGGGGGVASGVSYYDVWRNGVKVNSAPIPDAGAGPYTWSDQAGSSTSPASAATPTTFVYTVVAVDKSGNSSVQSPGLSILLDSAALSAPTGVTALATPTKQVPQISWVAPATPGFTIAHYEIFRNGGGSPVGVVPVGTTTFTDTTPSLPDGSYTYQVVAVSTDTIPLSGVASAAVNVVYDTTAPAAPGSVAATAALDGSIGVTWAASGDGSGSGIARYVVRRALSGTPPATVADGDATCQGTATSCTDSTALNGKLYSYAVFAIDRAGNTSLAGSSVGVTARDQTPPAAPKGLAATPHDASIDLRWTAAGPDDDVAGYALVAKQGTTAPTSDTDGTRVCTAIVATSAACTATGLTNGATYTFGLFALDEALNRSQPALVSAAPNGKVTDTKAPAAVSRLHASVSGRQVTLTWKNPSDKDFDHVEITSAERKPAALKASKRVYSGKGTKTTIKLPAGQSRWFVVVAYDAVGNASSPTSVHAAVKAPSSFGPAPKAKVHGAVKLSWPVAKGARYYNVQLYAGKTRILVSWPTGRAFQVPRAKLKRGTRYTWYVWPGLGAKAKAHYGKLIGKNVFTFAG